MTRYAAALLRRADGIVRAETFGAMIAPQYCPDSRFTNWGLSFQRSPVIERTFIGHGGAYFGGWNSHLDVSFEDDIAVIQHMNMMHPDPSDIFEATLRAVFNVPPAPLAPAPTAAIVLEQAPGLYELPPGRLTNFRPATGIGRVRVERGGDRLTLTSRWGDWKQGCELLPADPADPLFFAIEREGHERRYVAFTRCPDGRIDGIRYNRLVHALKVEER
jgi:hypothetical protein